MSLINELDIGFDECFNMINNHLLLDNSINYDVFKIQVEMFILNARKILDDKNENFSDLDKRKYREYLSLCEACLFIDKASASIDDMLFKEEYLSEEVYRYLITQMEYLGKKMDYLSNRKDSNLIKNYLNQVSVKYYNYIRVIKNKLSKQKIK